MAIVRITHKKQHKSKLRYFIQRIIAALTSLGHQNWHGLTRRGRNQSCQIWTRSVHGFRAPDGRKSLSPIDLRHHPYNSCALPCYTVIQTLRDTGAMQSLLKDTHNSNDYITTDETKLLKGRPPYWKWKIHNISEAVQLIATEFCMIMQSVAANRAKIYIFPKFKMADGRHIRNRKFAVSPQLFIASRQNFAGLCRFGSQTMRMLKFLYFTNIKFVDGRHIGNRKFAISPQPFNQCRSNFAWSCRVRLQTVPKVKICMFPKLTMADDRHIEN